MTNKDRTGADLAELERMLDAYGADDARWPATARARLRPLIIASIDAKRLVAEARALDSVLDKGRLKEEAAAPAGLTQAIMAAVAREAPTRNRPSVVPMASRLPQRTPAPATRSAPPWQWASVMAASLMLGLAVGVTTDIGSTIQDIAEAAGLSGDLGSVSLVFNDAHSSFDEDAL